MQLRNRSSKATSWRDHKGSPGNVRRASTAGDRAAKADHDRKVSPAKAGGKDRAEDRAAARGNHRARRARAPTSTRNSR